ncbi:MAG: sensor histidine kinase [Fibrobacterota bacterium]
MMKDTGQELRLTRMLLDIAQTFISRQSPDQRINQGIEQLGRSTKASRAYLFLFRSQGDVMDNTHEWCAPEITAQKENLQGIPFDMIPWWMKMLREDRIIAIEHVDSMPREAENERQILADQGIKSVLVVPLHVDGQLQGFIGLDNVYEHQQWDRDSLYLLKAAAGMVGSFIQRARHEAQILAKNQELKEAYINLKQAQGRLVHAEKMAGIGLVAQGLAHEINNPVSYMLSNTEVLQEYLAGIKSFLAQGRTPGNCPKYAEMQDILTDCDAILSEQTEGLRRVSGIIATIKQFSGADDRGGALAVDVNRILKTVLSLTESEINSVGTVRTDLSDVPLIRARAGELNQVFMNILLNALRALRCQGGGEIHVSTARCDTQVVVDIDDSGPGVNPRIADRIFDPFFTTADVGQGSGLGLSIAYDIVVKKIGGDISLQTSHLGGALFRITLPVSSSSEDK